MKVEEREALEKEWSEIQERLKGEFPSPKDIRRKDEIFSLFLTDGSTDKLRLGISKTRESNRVTSFTKDRR